MSNAVQKDRGLALGQAAALGLVLWVAAFGLALSFDDAGWRSGLAAGAVTGGLGGLVGMLLIMPALGKPMNAVVQAMSLGFFGRMVLIAAGLFVTIKRLDGEPLGFAFMFFPLFFVFVALEILVVARHAATAASGKSQES